MYRSRSVLTADMSAFQRSLLDSVDAPGGSSAFSSSASFFSSGRKLEISLIPALERAIQLVKQDQVHDSEHRQGLPSQLLERPGRELSLQLQQGILNRRR